jgi:capsular exopolysaccharide synthesis family protein
LLVTSAIAGEGKSTVAACLAVTTAESGTRTLLVECDLRKPVLAERMGIKEGPGLSDYLTGHADPRQILQPVAGIVERLNGSGPTLTAGQSGSANLVCIAAGRRVPRPAELLASERFRSFLTEVSDVYDTVILDTPPLLPVADTLAIVPDVSALVVCIRLEHTTREQALAAQSALDRLPERPVGLVLTDVRQEGDGYNYGEYATAATA